MKFIRVTPHRILKLLQLYEGYIKVIVSLSGSGRMGCVAPSPLLLQIKPLKPWSFKNDSFEKFRQSGLLDQLFSPPTALSGQARLEY